MNQPGNHHEPTPQFRIDPEINMIFSFVLDIVVRQKVSNEKKNSIIKLDFCFEHLCSEFLLFRKAELWSVGFTRVSNRFSKT